MKISRMIYLKLKWKLFPPRRRSETCEEFWAVEAEVARQQWEYVRGLDYVPPTQEEIDEVIKNQAGG